MTNALYRPPVGEVSLHLYCRQVHPELYEPLVSRVVRKDDYVLTFWITASGHVISWRTDDLVLTEVIASHNQPLPTRGQVWRHRFHGEANDAFRASARISYQMCTQLEYLPPQLFTKIHDDLVSDGRKRGMLHQFVSRQNYLPPPLGFITADARMGCLVINSFHTFPNDGALLKTQTLIERV